MDPINVADYEALAAARLEPGVLGYYAGGAGDERTLRDNVDAFARLRLRPRVLVDVSDVSTATTVLGSEVTMPILVAPTALQRLAHPDGEPAMARAAAAAGTIFTLSTLATSRPREVCEHAPPAPRWFQLYAFRDAAVTRALCDEAIACGFDAIVLTVDASRTWTACARRAAPLRSVEGEFSTVVQRSRGAVAGRPVHPAGSEARRRKRGRRARRRPRARR
jgi:isopentenyl diphosphate isomerase/L-lactate dehydrogenase-like FMN-dependent dehydrogenase